MDADFGVLSEKILAVLTPLGAAQAPRFIVNTHYHFDHTDGNEAFAKMGALVIAQTQLRSRLAAGGTIGKGGSIAREVKAGPAAALPALTYEQGGLYLTAKLHAPLPACAHRRDSVVFFRQGGPHERHLRALRHVHRYQRRPACAG